MLNGEFTQRLQELRHRSVELTSWLNELEQFGRETIQFFEQNCLLLEQGSRVLAAEEPEEAHLIIATLAEQLFRPWAGVLYVRREDEDRLEQKAAWGKLSPVELSFAPKECWALHSGDKH